MLIIFVFTNWHYIIFLVLFYNVIHYAERLIIINRLILIIFFFKIIDKFLDINIVNLCWINKYIFLDANRRVGMFICFLRNFPASFLCLISPYLLILYFSSDFKQETVIITVHSSFHLLKNGIPLFFFLLYRITMFHSLINLIKKKFLYLNSKFLTLQMTFQCPLLLRLFHLSYIEKILSQC